MPHPADKHIYHMDGPFALVRVCKLCNHKDVVKKPPEGQRGRGWGMREGNKQRGRLIQHIKAEHPKDLED